MARAQADTRSYLVRLSPAASPFTSGHAAWWHEAHQLALNGCCPELLTPHILHCVSEITVPLRRQILEIVAWGSAIAGWLDEGSVPLEFRIEQPPADRPSAATIRQSRSLASSSRRLRKRAHNLYARSHALIAEARLRRSAARAGLLAALAGGANSGPRTSSRPLAASRRDQGALPSSGSTQL
jgi:hypothetical protein